jgi:DNA replication protein DnaC
MNDIAYDPETLDLDPMLKRLHLAWTRRNWLDLCERAEAEDWSSRKLLSVLFHEEIAHRQNTRVQRTTRQAGFPYLRTVDEFDFTLQSGVRRALLGTYLGPELVSEARNLVLYGKTGRGKTHLAIAVAYKAIQNGFTARFVTAAALIDELSAASRTARFREALHAYLQPSVLVIDEVGYLTYGDDAANVLFHVVNERCLKGKPMIFTTNKTPLGEWGDVLHDHDLADAIVDRILERGRLIVLDGPSYRTRHIRVDRPAIRRQAQPDRVSGIDRTEFPEPTSWRSQRGEATNTGACLPRLRCVPRLSQPLDALFLTTPCDLFSCH